MTVSLFEILLVPSLFPFLPLLKLMTWISAHSREKEFRSIECGNRMELFKEKGLDRMDSLNFLLH